MTIEKTEQEQSLLHATQPVILSSEELKDINKEFFGRCFYHENTYVGKVIYSVDTLFASDAYAHAIENIPLESCFNLINRETLEEAITVEQVYDEIRHQLSDEKYKNIPWSEIESVISLSLYQLPMLKGGLLDRTLPVKEALAAWVKFRISGIRGLS